MTLAYERLAALAEHEWSLVTAEAWEQLETVAADRAVLVAALPAVAPLEAATWLARAAELQALISAALVAARRQGAPALARLITSRDAVHGYASSAAQRLPSA